MRVKAVQGSEEATMGMKGPSLPLFDAHILGREKVGSGVQRGTCSCKFCVKSLFPSATCDTPIKQELLYGARMKHEA